MVSICPLHVEELAEILAIQFNEEALPTFNTDWRPAYAEETIMSVCSSLIAIVDRGDHQVILHMLYNNYMYYLDRMAV